MAFNIPILDLHGRQCSDAELDELVALLASEAFDVEYEDPPGWSGGVTRETKVYVCTAAKNVLAAQGPEALIRVARAYDALPTLGRQEVHALYTEASFDTWAAIDATRRAAILDTLARAAPRDEVPRWRAECLAHCRFIDVALRALEAHDDAALGRAIFEGLHGNFRTVPLAESLVPRLVDREPLRRSILAELLAPPSPPGHLTATLRAISPALSPSELAQLEAALEHPRSSEHEATLLTALEPALAAGQLDEATRRRFLQFSVRLCATSDTGHLAQRRRPARTHGAVARAATAGPRADRVERLARSMRRPRSPGLLRSRDRGRRSASDRAARR